MTDEQCPHGCGELIHGAQGDPLEPIEPYCPACSHIHGPGCDGGCNDEAQAGERE